MLRFFVVCLQLLLITLKLVGIGAVASWSWWWVWSPMLVFFGLTLAIFLSPFALILLAALLEWVSSNKRRWR